MAYLFLANKVISKYNCREVGHSSVIITVQKYVVIYNHYALQAMGRKLDELI